MSIFKKKFIRHSEVTIGIEADSEAEAQKAFDEWYEEDHNNWNELSNRLSECETDSEEWVCCYPNRDFYNRYGKADDFFISEPKRHEEPLYDLYIRFNDYRRPNGIESWFDCSMNTVLEKLGQFNNDYILTQQIPPYGIVPESRMRRNLFYFEAERRH